MDNYLFFTAKERIKMGKPCFVCKNGNISNKQYWMNQKRKFIGLSDKIVNNKVKVKIRGKSFISVKDYLKIGEIIELT